MKYVACKGEISELKEVVEQLRTDLDNIQGCMNKKRRTQIKSDRTNYYHEMKARATMVEDENAGLKITLVQERKQLDDLMERNEELVEGNRVCCRVMGELRDKITKLSNANDVLTSEAEDLLNENDILRRQVRQHEAGQAGERELERDNERAVCRAFGWSKLKVDPTLLRAACGFWSGTVQCSTGCENTTDVGDSRINMSQK
jgi:chromosome segregation ATPase